MWTYNFETKEAKPMEMEGIDCSGGQTVVYAIDKRTLVTIPAADHSNTRVFEVSFTTSSTRRAPTLSGSVPAGPRQISTRS